MNRLASLLVVAASAAACFADAPLKYATRWVGNSFGGGKEWVQNFAEDLAVLPDGTCVVGSFWDEAGREVGLYRDGRVVGQIQHTHMRGGKAIAASAKHLFYAHTCLRPDQPAVKAGESPREKQVCWFGMSRYTLDGSPAPFAGGKTEFRNMAVFREAPDDHDLIPRGMATDGRVLYVADSSDNRIRVFDVETMKPVRDFPAAGAERIALDGQGRLWVLLKGGKKVLSLTADGTMRNCVVPLPNDAVAAALEFAPDGRLIVADHGPRQQLLYFDVSGSEARLVRTFGDEGGMYSGPVKGLAGPTRLAMPTGMGYDASGNLYVACNLPPTGGAVLRSFSPDGKLRWELLGLEFVSVADALPGSDGRTLLTSSRRYSFDRTASAGRGWTWEGSTYDPFRSPDDLRRHLPMLQCGTSVRMLGGRPFLCLRGMWQGALGIYRQEGGLFVPSVVLSSGPLKAEKSDWAPSGQPRTGRWLWRDVNGDGRFSSEEFTATDGPTGEFWASNVDPAGDLWQAGRESGVWRWKFRKLDPKGNPEYDPRPDHWTMPSPFNDLLRTEYDPETDSMILTGATNDRPISGGEWGTAGTVAVRYDDWTKSPKLRYRIDLPYEADKTFMASMHAAGGLIFVVDCKRPDVYVYSRDNGAKIGVMRPGPEVAGESGWGDFRDALRAVRLSDGRYMVCVEEDWKAKVLVYLLDDPLAAPVAVQPEGDGLSGRKLLVTMVRTGNTQVFVADPATGDLINLTRSTTTEDRYPCWSPDGRRVAFTRDRGEFKDLWVIDADGRNAKELVHAKATCYMPSWRKTPGGERIVFGFHGAKAEMACVRPDGTDLKILGEGHDPTLSPDGERICFTGEVPGGVSVFVMNWDGSDRRRVVKETSRVGATFPNWSPDGRKLVYSFPIEGALELFLCNADGTNGRRLTTFGGSSVCTPADWSPDGKWISFRRTDERYWSDPRRMKAVYAAKPADKRPVWVIRPDGTGAKAVECLKFQCAIDGSRAAWQPLASSPAPRSK